MKIDEKEIRKLRKALRIEYNKLREGFEKLAGMIKASDLLLDTIESIYEVYGGNLDEE